jgi:glucosamine kinase
MPFYLAIDAGGTSTRCALADSGRILGRASTGSVKLMRVAEPEATARLHAMLDQVSAAAGVPLTRVTQTCFGLAGLSIPAVRAWATRAIAARISTPLTLLGDEEIALDAAFRPRPGPGAPPSSTPWAGGILIIAGTGSNIIGRTAGGTLHRAGGWGPVLGDEGAGYWIGLEAIRAALRALDHEPGQQPGQESGSTIPTPGTTTPQPTPATQLLDAIQHHWNLPTLAHLIEYGNHRGDATRPAPDFAALAPIVAHLAQPAQPNPQSPEHPPNPIALAILHRAGADLAGQVTLVARKMAAHQISAADSAPGASALEVAFTGSVLTQIAPVREAMIARLAQALPHARVHSTPVDPLDGALYRARQA